MNDLNATAATILAWVNGPLLRGVLVLALCLAVVLAAHWMLRRTMRRLRERDRSDSTLTRGDVTAIVIILSLATVFVGVAFAMSAATLHDSATWLENTAVPINGGDLRILFPLVLDGLIVLFLALDLWTEWRQMRHPYYRWVAYGLSVLTLYLNVSHGGDGALLGHAAPPLGVIVISEGLAIWIRSMARMIDTGKTTDRVPMGHWIARPASAFRVWRLMLGWNIGSYEDAVEMERRRSMAYAMLREQHGSEWRRATPRHVRWMLNNGHDLDVAYGLTRAMTRDRVAMSPEEVSDVVSGRRDTPALEATPRSDDRSLLSRLTVRSGHDRVARGRSSQAIGQGDTATPAGHDTPVGSDTTPDTVQATADVASESEPEGTRLHPAGADPMSAPVSRPVASLSDMAGRDQRVVSWLSEDPDMSGAEIGRRLDTTAKTGQRLKARLADVARQSAAGHGGWRIKQTGSDSDTAVAE